MIGSVRQMMHTGTQRPRPAHDRRAGPGHRPTHDRRAAYAHPTKCAPAMRRAQADLLQQIASDVASVRLDMATVKSDMAALKDDGRDHETRLRALEQWRYAIPVSVGIGGIGGAGGVTALVWAILTHTH